MSHNYYRPPPAAKDLRASSYDSPDHLHAGDHGHNVYRSSQEPPSHSPIPSYPSSSSRASTATEAPYSSSLSRSDSYSYSLSRSDPYSSSLSRSDQTLTLLSSCGLEPKDLSLLAEMPEELITVENLPRMLLEIRKKRATQQPPYPAMTSYPSAATSCPPPSGRAWEQGDRSRSQPLDYTLDPNPALPPSQLLPTEQAEPWQLDRHGNPMQYTRSRLEPVPVRVVDYRYGKETPRSYETPRSTYSTAQGGSSSRKPSIPSQPAVDYRYPPPPATDYRPRLDQDVPVVTLKMATSGNTPTKKAALDFHGEIPQTFPYSCSLCDITVLSEKFWFAHANGTQHADGQLTLLQMYPEWDCRMQTARNGDDHTERPRVEEKTGGPSHRSIDYIGKPSSSGSRKSIDRKTNATKMSGKVVCAKFTARCLNEDGLKDLIKPFGEVVKIIMFPALAFVEMGSTDQAEDIVTYYLSNPVVVKEGQVTFSVSSTFNFLQSSRVLSFFPVPPGKESAAWKRELLAVAKGFGPVEHSLFLPTQAFVEMTNALDAQKLVGHHTSKYLIVDGIHIKVAFSSEYNTLRTMSERKSSDRSRKSSDRSRKSSDRSRKSSDRSRKSSDRSKRKSIPSPRRRSLSPRRDSPTSSKRRRRRSRERNSDHHKEREKSNGGGKSRPRSPCKQSSSRSSRSPHSHTKERVSSEEKTPGSGKTDPKKYKVSPTSTRSQPPTKNTTTVMEKSEKAGDKTDQSKQETETQDTQEDGAMEACDMDSDIEGMAVYGEDGEENSDMGEEVGEGGVGEDEVGEDEGGVGEDEVGEDEVGEGGLGEDEGGVGEDEGGVGEDEGGVGEDEGGVGEDEGGVGEDEGRVAEEEGGLAEEEGVVAEEEGGLAEEEGVVAEDEGGLGEDEGEEDDGEEEQQESAEDLIQEFISLCEPKQKSTSTCRTVDDAPTEELSATGSEQGKELSATGSEQGKELSATGSEQGKELSTTGSKQGKELSATGSKQVKELSEQGKELSAIRSEQGKELSATGSEQGKELSATRSEQGKELSATGSEQGKELSATGSEQGKERDGEDQKADASYVDDEEEPDFPEDLENLITLDELEDGSSADDQDNQSTDETKSRSKSKTSGRDQPSGRVIYVKNLPRGYYTDTDFLKIVKGFGRVHRYFLLRNGEEGFIEMERSSDATKALRELRYNGCKLYGQKLIILRSQKYKRLTTGWKPESDSDSKSDRKKDHRNTRSTSSSSRIRSGQTSSHSKSAAKDEKTKEKDEKTKEKDEKTKEKDEKTKEKDEKTKEKDEKTKEKTARQVCSEQRSKQSSEPVKHCDKEDRGASEVNTDKSSNSEDQKDAPVPAAEEERRACSTEDNAETKMEDNVETGPDSMKTGMESSLQPNNPVGREFIKPVMGYFCNLCKVIYVNEDEAKNQHCSSLCHYLKFMEHTGKDTASS